MGNERASRHSLFRVAVAVAFVVLTSTLQPAAGAQTAADDRPVDASEPLRLQLPTEQDRELVPVPQNLNVTPDVYEATPTFDEANTPKASVRDEVPLLDDGDATTDIYAEPHGGGDHLAVVFPSEANTENTKGEWIDLSIDPIRDGEVWTLATATWSADVPLEVSDPLVYRSGEAALASTLLGAETVRGSRVGAEITYPGAFPSTDVTVAPVPGGYREDLTLLDEKAPLTFTWRLDPNGLILTPIEGGGIAAVDEASIQVAVISAPVVYDSAEPTEIDGLEWTLVESADVKGAFELSTTIDAAWAAKATYPLILDPGTASPEAAHDAYTDNQNPDNNFGGANTLETGPRYDTFLKFPTTWQQTDRIVYSAKIWLFNTSQVNANDTLTVRRVTGGWNNNGITAANQPGTDLVPDLSPASGPTDDWWQIGVGKLYQGYNDGDWPDQGVRLSGERKTFKSTNAANNHPYLLVSYNDQPNPPNAKSPGNENNPSDPVVVENLRPTLVVQKVPNDPNGDDVLLNYQVTGVASDWSDPVWQSGWTSDESVRIPSGELNHGAQYWWRVQSADVCTPPEGLCDKVDAQGEHHQWPKSTVYSFTTALKNQGSDPRWAMWSEGIGNGMSLNVNESNGNLFLDVPLDSVRNPLGYLKVGLSYNSQRDANGLQLGLGDGWRLKAGPASSTQNLPVALKELSPVPYGGVEIEYGSGRTETYPYRSARTFAPVGAGSSIVTKNAGGKYLLRTPEGDEYVFDSSGNVTEVKPVSTKPRVLPGQERHYRYEYSSSGNRLERIYDALGREIVSVVWTSSAPFRITRVKFIPSELGGAGWYDFGYTNGTLTSISNPEQETITFAENNACTGKSLLSHVQNGEQSAIAKPGWKIEHFLDEAPAGVNYDVCRVKKLFPPQESTSTRHWLLEYGVAGQGYGAFTSMATYITDPRGTVGGTAGDFRTRVDFNSMGFPIRIEGAKALPASEDDWVSTMQWDENGNLVCSRSPQANAVSYGCHQGGALTGMLTTEYVNENREPFLLKSMLHPAPENDSNAKRVLQEYVYDGGGTFQGLWAEMYDNSNLAGLPADQGLWPGLNQTWQASQAPGTLDGDGNWSVRLSGMLDVPVVNGAVDTKRYEFKVTHDDGVTVGVGGRLLMDCYTDNGSNTNCGANNDPKMNLRSGERPITVEFKNASGDSQLTIKWKQQGDQGFTIIPLASQIPNRGLLTTYRTGPNVGGADLRLETQYGFPGDLAKMRRLPSWKKEIGKIDGVPDWSRQTNFGYDDYGRRTSTTRFFGTDSEASWTKVYSDTVAAGTCVDHTLDPTGALVEYDCNDMGDITETRTKVRARTIEGTQVQDLQWRTEQRSYDDVGRVLAIQGPGSGETIFTYDAAGRTKTVAVKITGGATPGYATTSYAYTSYGLAAAHGSRMIETLPDPDPAASNDQPVITHLYDWLGNEVSYDDPRNAAHVWGTTYDGQNRVTSVSSPDPDGAGSLVPLTTSTTHSISPFTTTVTDPAGVATVTTFDMLGRKAKEKVGAMQPTTFTYDAVGNLAEVRSQSGSDPSTLTWAKHAYNAFGKEEVTTTPWLNGTSVVDVETQFAYHAETGKLASIDGPLSGAQRKDQVDLGRDAAQRLTSVTMHAKNTQSYKTKIFYNDADERIRLASDLTVSDAANPLVQLRDFTFNVAGQLVQTKEYHGANSGVFQGTTRLTERTTAYEYFLAGWLKKVTEGSVISDYSYDNLGRETSRTGGGKTISTTYYKDGSIKTTTGTDGKVWQFVYDGMGRTTSLTRQTAPSYATNYVYNGLGQLASETADGRQTSYVYYPDATPGPGEFAGLLKSQTDAVTAGTTTYTYDTAGRVATRVDPANMTWTRTYETATGRIDTQTITKPLSGTPRILAYFDLDHDEAGNVVTRDEKIWHNEPAPAGVNPETATSPSNTGTWTYSYDGASRMLTATGPKPPQQTGTGTWTYTYDGQGNRLTELVPGAAIPIATTTDAQGWPVATDNGTPANTSDDTALKYDTAGNLWQIQAPASQLSTTFTYDVWARTTKSVTSGSASSNVTYAIDAFGRTSSAGSTTYRYAGEGETLVAETTGSTTTTYSHTPGGPLARKVGSTAEVFIRDLHGDVVGRLGLTATNMPVATWFSPWGAPTPLEGAAARLGYQGQITESTTGTVDMMTRQYLPALGRFTTRDVLFGKPRDPLSLNQYGYGHANPVTNWDPLGLSCSPALADEPCSVAPADTDGDNEPGGVNGGAGSRGVGGTAGHDEDGGSSPPSVPQRYWPTPGLSVTHDKDLLRTSTCAWNLTVCYVTTYSASVAVRGGGTAPVRFNFNVAEGLSVKIGEE